ncbi:PREDICTED: lisH domain-containing protein FOPNL-like [Nicrophorus vespilloides]|uniref:LisH domain-containing protein FOPNL-like n=1 Tax=Nicrophorus vespilloides TaxID=110193 RepID=A0ABM1MV82_NICVS|nr:PREDICTED: lisH domain-containing protein FOPNL-like [Nicrophorus vespilloides]
MSGEPTERDLLEAVKESLNQVGSLGHFKAELRAAVMSILNKNTNHKVPSSIPEETKVINELIREYLGWNGYIYTEQILVAESGDNGAKVIRENLATKLGVLDDNKTQKIPLLYYVLSAFKNQES